MYLKKLTILTALAVSMGAAASFASEDKAHWAYSGEAGPEHWGDLSAEYATCATGRMQSPIDLAKADAAGEISYEVDYKPVPLTILNNGHTIQFNTGGVGTLSEKDVEYKLLQIHFHAPSEHVVDGKHAPLEAHFVHRSDEGALAVLGVMFVEGAENPALATLIAHMPASVSEPETIEGVTIDPAALLPEDMDIYRYMGSLTTPPCSEGVNWHVLSKHVTASKSQIEMLATQLHKNFRPAQPLNERLLVAPAD